MKLKKSVELTQMPDVGGATKSYLVTRTVNTTEPSINAELNEKEVRGLIERGITITIKQK